MLAHKKNIFKLLVEDLKWFKYKYDLNFLLFYQYSLKLSYI